MTKISINPDSVSRSSVVPPPPVERQNQFFYMYEGKDRSYVPDVDDLKLEIDKFIDQYYPDQKKNQIMKTAKDNFFQDPQANPNDFLNMLAKTKKVFFIDARRGGGSLKKTKTKMKRRNKKKTYKRRKSVKKI
jgi:hypothetical protein